MALHTYDPAQVTIIVAGIPISGKGEATFLSIERNEDAWALQVGADGEATRAKSNNRSGRATITLIQSSAANDALSAIANVDEKTPGGDGIFPLLIKDLSGRTLVQAETAWIVKQAAAEFAREASEREWIVESDNMEVFVAGNSSVAQHDGKQVTIDGFEYTVYPLAPKRSAKLLARLGRVVVPAVGIVGAVKRGSGGGSGLLDADVDGELFSKLAAEAFERLDDALLDELLGAFAEVSVASSSDEKDDRRGKLSQVFDQHFRGRMGALLEWLAFCLRTEYADVLKKTSGAIDRAGLGLRLRESPSPSTSPKTG